MIRKATAADLPSIGGIYDAIFDLEEQGGPVYTNWLRGTYPTIESARQVLEAGTLYVGEEDGVLWGVLNLNGIQLPEYSNIPWTIPAEEEEVAVIHTMCIHPAQSGKGYARQMIAFCEETARAQGKTVMRFDTWEGNAPANHLYPKLGYHFAGGTEFFFQGYIHEILNCYEKKL
ncbi:MAG: GNAT family N-acetyltransferase [Oscillibacter sp.]|nr:GNAT family N-acetyltransferase [Oscillibacter sp.]MCI9002773.1 GNAT family N-acetyltransferase [Oscillibacter sp.]